MGPTYKEKNPPIFLQRDRTCWKAGKSRKSKRSTWRRWRLTSTTDAGRSPARSSRSFCRCWPNCGPSATRTARCASVWSSRTKSCQFSSLRSGTWHPSSPVADPRRLTPLLFHRESAQRPEWWSWQSTASSTDVERGRAEPPVLVHHHATAWVIDRRRLWVAPDRSEFASHLLCALHRPREGCRRANFGSASWS